MEVINKRYNHDHASAYKSRGHENHGMANRFVRANQAKEERKTSRRNELTKRRGIPDIIEQKTSIEDMKDSRKKQPGKAANNQVKAIEKENLSSNVKITDQRKAMLLKWREQREFKRKTDAALRSQKTVFAVRHVQYNDNSTSFPPTNTKQSKKALSKPKENIQDKRPFTRSSARIAAKVPTKPQATKGKTVSISREVKTTRKTSAKQDEELPKRVTRQSAKTITTSKPNGTKKSKTKDEPKKSDEEKSKPENLDSTGKKESPIKVTSPSDRSKKEPKSFAPSNFQFTAPTGLKSFENYSTEFKFQPLSPGSAANFFQGVTGFSSAKQESINKDNFTPVSTMEDEMAVSEVIVPDALPTNKDKSDKKQGNRGEKVLPESNYSAPVIDSGYFRNLVTSETARLNGLCDQWEKEMEASEDLTEEVRGSIRTAVGQAQLLISQRFKQFSGLIDLSEDETAEKKATMTDLQGFWDMIYFQVEDVKTKLDELEKQKQNGWVIEEKVRKKKKVKKIAPKKAETGKTAKPSGKSKIQELRAAMKAKMAEKKKELQSQGVEECSFITVLTPVKKKKQLGSHGDVILTPVRRSLRNTPVHQLASNTCTPKVVSTPKTISTTSPGLRLTPEVTSTTTNDVENEDSEMKDELSEQEQEALDMKDSEIREEKPERTLGNNILIETKTESSSESNSGSTDEEMNNSKLSPSKKRRSCLRSSTKRTRKSSRVFFQSPEPSGHSTAGGTPGAIVFTPGLQSNKRPTSVVFTPVTVCFDSPDDGGHTCFIDAGHTPALPLSGRRSLRSRTSNGTPLPGRKRHIATPDVSLITSNSDQSPVCLDEGSLSKRRSLRRRSVRKSSGTSDEETAFLPDKYILPSTSSESDEDAACQQLTAFMTDKPESSDNHNEQLLPFTPLKDSSSRINKSLTPASRLQTLSLDVSLEDRRDSVFSGQGGSLVYNGKGIQDNLISFSPLTL